ncbi:MAG: hypothetical protein E7251_03790 [Paenibacillaceae bacterium]|nr:hypothetical protein [Paenibacillaceae bacterium]
MSEKESDKSIKKKCFVITPIGDEADQIRRHIDGIIDQAIIPAIGDKYEIEVSHRKYEIGSINDRIVKSVYESELVIANLTGLNPNVMYELAIRYSFGKPVIVIAEKATKLPFDIIDENTIFYVNDPKGANDLKESIMQFEKNIDSNKEDYGPIFRAISKIPLYKDIELNENVSNQKLITYIIDRLDSIEENNRINRSISSSKYFKGLEVLCDNYANTDPDILISDLKKALINYNVGLKEVSYSLDGVRIIFDCRVDGGILDLLKNEITSVFFKHDINSCTIRQILY